jgi:hypothetical protein
MSALPPESGHLHCTSRCLLCANSGHFAATLNAEGATLRYPFKRPYFFLPLWLVSSYSAGPDVDHADSRQQRSWPRLDLPTRASASVAMIAVAGTARLNAAADGKGPFPEKQKPVWTSAIAGRRANGNIPGGSNNKMELSEFEFQPWCFNKVDANRN